METSPNLNLPYLLPNQAQKHVTVNEAIRNLDAVVQLSVLSRTSSTASQTAIEGDRHIIGPNATDAWFGYTDTVAAYVDGGWVFFPPQTGWLAWVEDESVLIVWSGSQWDIVQSSADLQNIPSIGINATADTVNRLALSADATLLSHDGASHQLKINKNSEVDSASMLFQTQFSGHAELGLTGNNHMHIKVSPDGQAWREAVQIDNLTGNVTLPCMRSGLVQVTNDTSVSIPTPNAGGFILLMITGDSYPQTAHSGILAYDTGLSLRLHTLILAGGVTNQGTNVLTGTTGPDDKTNVSVASGAIMLENRFGSTQKFSYTFLG